MFSQESKRVLLGWTGAAIVAAILGGSVMGVTAVVENHNTQMAVLQNQYESFVNNNAQPLPYSESQNQNLSQTYGSGWLTSYGGKAYHIKSAQVIDQPDGSYLAVIKLTNGSQQEVYSSDGFLFTNVEPKVING